MFSCKTELKMLTIWKTRFWVCVPNKFTIGRTCWPCNDVIFIESLYRLCPQLSRRLDLNTKTRILLGLLVGRKPVLKWCWNVGSETTHPVKFLPELTCKSKVSLNCLEQVKIIKGLQMWERRKKIWGFYRGWRHGAGPNPFFVEGSFGTWKLLEAFVQMSIE